MTDVAGEALAIADGVREIVGCFWRNHSGVLLAESGTVRGIMPAKAVDLADERGSTL